MVQIPESQLMTGGESKKVHENAWSRMIHREFISHLSSPRALGQNLSKRYACKMKKKPIACLPKIHLYLPHRIESINRECSKQLAWEIHSKVRSKKTHLQVLADFWKTVTSRCMSKEVGSFEPGINTTSTFGWRWPSTTHERGSKGIRWLSPPLIDWLHKKKLYSHRHVLEESYALACSIFLRIHRMNTSSTNPNKTLGPRTSIAQQIHYRCIQKWYKKSKDSLWWRERPVWWRCRPAEG